MGRQFWLDRQENFLDKYFKWNVFKSTPKFQTKISERKMCVHHSSLAFSVNWTPFSYCLPRRGTLPIYLLGGVYMRKLAPARVSHWDEFLISYRVYMMTGSFHILLFNGTFHVDKIHVWFKIANITHALPVPVYRQTNFTPKWVVVSRLHDTVARFRTGVKFSPR